MTSYICTLYGCKALLPVLLINLQASFNTTFSTVSVLPVAVAKNSGYFSPLQQNMLVWALFICLLQALCMIALEAALCTAIGRSVIYDWFNSKSGLTRKVADLVAASIVYQHTVLCLEAMGIDLMRTANSNIRRSQHLQTLCVDKERRISDGQQLLTRRESDNSSEKNDMRAQISDKDNALISSSNTIESMAADSQFQRDSFEAMVIYKDGLIDAANLRATNSEVARAADAVLSRSRYAELEASTASKLEAMEGAHQLELVTCASQAVAPYKFTLRTLKTNSMKEPSWAEGLGVSLTAGGTILMTPAPAWGDVYDSEVQAMKIRIFNEEQAAFTTPVCLLSSTRPSISESAYLLKALHIPVLCNSDPIDFAYAIKPSLEGRPSVAVLERFISQARGDVSQVRGYRGLLALARAVGGAWEMRRIDACRALVETLGASEAYAAVYNLPRTYSKGIFGVASVASTDSASMRLAYNTLLPLIHPTNNPRDVQLATTVTRFVQDAGSMMVPSSSLFGAASLLIKAGGGAYNVFGS